MPQSPELESQPLDYILVQWLHGSGVCEQLLCLHCLLPLHTHTHSLTHHTYHLGHTCWSLIPPTPKVTRLQLLKQ